MTCRIIVADDHPIFREGLVRSLEEGGFEIVGTAGDAETAVALVREHAPDLALLDISMPGGGIEAARRIHTEAPQVRIAMLTVSEDEAAVSKSLEAGAIAYVLKGVSAAELNGILAGVARGEAHVSPRLAARVLAEMRRAPEIRDPATHRRSDEARGGHPAPRGHRHEQPRSRRGARHQGEDGQTLHDRDPREAPGPQPRRGRADRAGRLGWLPGPLTRRGPDQSAVTGPMRPRLRHVAPPPQPTRRRESISTRATASTCRSGASRTASRERRGGRHAPARRAREKSRIACRSPAGLRCAARGRGCARPHDPALRNGPGRGSVAPPTAVTVPQGSAIAKKLSGRRDP